MLAFKDVKTCKKMSSNPSYSVQVDNPLRLILVDDVLFGPAIDSEGNIRGIVQLFHKKRGDVEDTLSIERFKRLLPAVAGLIKQVDDLRRANDMLAEVRRELAKNSQMIFRLTDAL